MALQDTLIARGIPPRFWPPLNDKGEAISRWAGRSRSCNDSFAYYLAHGGNSRTHREHLRTHHVAKADRAELVQA